MRACRARARPSFPPALGITGSHNGVQLAKPKLGFFAQGFSGILRLKIDINLSLHYSAMSLVGISRRVLKFSEKQRRYLIFKTGSRFYVVEKNRRKRRFFVERAICAQTLGTVLALAEEGSSSCASKLTAEAAASA